MYVVISSCHELWDGLENFAPILTHTKGMDLVGILRLLQSPVLLLSKDCVLPTMGIGMGIKCSM